MIYMIYILIKKWHISSQNFNNIIKTLITFFKEEKDLDIKIISFKFIIMHIKLFNLLN